jgi:hypothetical protein
VFVHATMSLDGFIARPDDTIDWAFKFGADETVDEIIQEIGAVFMGHRGWPGATPMVNQAPNPRHPGAMAARVADPPVSTASQPAEVDLAWVRKDPH